MNSTDDVTYGVRPMGVVSSSRRRPLDDDWGDVLATITLVPPFGAPSLTGLDEFSHVEVLFMTNPVIWTFLMNPVSFEVAAPPPPPT
jgi:tRNA (Thr-GGU) A37 N-methylase